MPYIGKQLVRGQNRELDDISSSFNGATTTFNLTVAGDSVTPGSALQLFISIGGVLQNPNTDFTVAGNQITFSTAPGSGLSFFGYLQGDAVDFNTPADGSVTTAKLGSNLTINVADGSAATPSIQFNGSGTDTGFYSPAADEIAITEGGSEALRIDSSGRLLVGTSSALSILTRSIDLAGVGTSTAQPFINIAHFANAANAASRPALSFYRTRGTQATPTANSSDDLLAQINFNAYDGNSTDSYSAGRIECFADAAHGVADTPGRLVFSTTADGASSPTEQMRITSDAYVRLASGTGGIQFGGDTAAANALDDYEEGTWTPSIGRTGTFGTYTPGANDGAKYTKIGNVVYFSVRVDGTSTGASGGNWVIRGLPFTVANNTSWGRTMASATDDTAATAFRRPRTIENSTDIDMGVLVSGNNVYCAGFYYVN